MNVFFPRIWSDSPHRLLGTTKVRNASTQRQAGSGTTLSQQQALLPRDGNRLRAGSLPHGHRHHNGVCDNLFFFANQSVSLTSNDGSLVRDGHRSHVRTRDFFSIDSRPESSSQVSCVSRKNSHSSHRAQHVARAFVVVSFTIEHYLIFHSFHLQSYPTLYSTVNQRFIDVIFTRGFSLRRSIECVFRSCG